MTLQQLRYILELSKHNSISAAAQALNIAQPSLSAAIKDLETEFSLTLVKRNRHGITFTSAGLEFLHYADHILAHADEMHDHFHPETGQEDSHTLTVSSQHYPFADEAFIHALQRISPTSAYTFTLREGRTSQVIHDVVTRESQLGILFLSHMNENFLQDLFQKNKLEFTSLCTFTPAWTTPWQRVKASLPASLRTIPASASNRVTTARNFLKNCSYRTHPIGKASMSPTDRHCSASSAQPTPILSERGMSHRPSSGATSRPSPLPIPWIR